MNIFIIIADSLRADYVSCYDASHARTPNIDALAEDAMLFTHAFPENIPTVPTRTTIQLGRYTFPYRAWEPLRPSDVLLPEVLWNHGYASALFTDCYHLHKPGFGFGRGFDHVEFIRGQEGDPWNLSDLQVPLPAHHKDSGDANRDRKVRDQLTQYLKNRSGWKSVDDCFTAQVVARTIRWLEQQRGDRLFVIMDLFDPHEPWDPMPPYDRMYTDPGYSGKDLWHPVPGPSDYLSVEEIRHIRNLYAGMCTMVDHYIGVFLDRLKALGIYDHALLFFFSDHGEPFAERGIIRKARPWPYTELCHIPFLLRHPEGHGARTSCGHFVQLCDVAPTVLQALGIDIPESMNGENILPLLHGGGPVRDAACFGMVRQSFCIRDHAWSYLVWPDPAASRKTEPELYNLQEDPGETRNLAGKMPDKAQEMNQRLLACIRKVTPDKESWPQWRHP